MRMISIFSSINKSASVFPKMSNIIDHIATTPRTFPCVTPAFTFDNKCILLIILDFLLVLEYVMTWYYRSGIVTLTQVHSLSLLVS